MTFVSNRRQGNYPTAVLIFNEAMKHSAADPVPILPKATNIVLQIFVTCTFYISLPFINMYILVGQDFLQSF
jgi:hypothetical protein